MARATMAKLIDRVRLIIGDPSATGQQFTDDQIQSALDAHRLDIRYQEMREVETRAAGTGTISYVEFWAPSGLTDWEDDEAIVDYAYNPLTASTSENQVGRWVFASDKSTVMPLYITGKSFDVYAAAGDLCEQWAAAVAIEFDYAAGAVSPTWQLKRDQLQGIAALCRKRTRPTTASMVRTDTQ